IDIDQIRAFALRGDDMVVPDLVEESARRGHTGNPSDASALAAAGRRRLGCRSRARPGALGDACRLTRETAQIIELCPAHHPATHYFNGSNPRRVERKDAFNSLAVRDLAQGKVRVDAGVLAGDAHPFKGLDALALALDYSDHDPHRITRLEFRHRSV